MDGRLSNSYLEVDLGILRENVRAILADLHRHGDAQLIPVLKDRAYGLGETQVARELSRFPEIRCFAVAHVSEGLKLREAGIDREILITGLALPFQMEEAVRADLTLACGRPGFLRELSDAARRVGKPAKIHLKIDTGLHRIGIEPGELEAWIAEYRECRGQVLAEGVFSHFSDADNLMRDEEEFRIFQDAVAALSEAGITFPIRHMAASASSERYPQFVLDGVRCGRRLYMDHPTVPQGKIRECVSWRSYITGVKLRKAGECIGYGGKVRLEHDTAVATVAVGYGDGLNQELVRIGGPVLADGKRCRLLACCMDQCLLDVTGTECRVGDEVTFFGCDGKGNFLSSQEVAALVNDDEGCGLTAALSDRVARIYV